MFLRRRERKLKQQLFGLEERASTSEPELPPELRSAFRKRKNSVTIARARPHFSFARFGAYATAASLAVALACQLPSTYEIPVGYRVQTTLPTSVWDQHEAELRDLDVALREFEGVESVSMTVHTNQEDGDVGVDVHVWGRGQFTEKDVIARLHASFPWMAHGEIQTQTLSGEYHGTFASRIRHRFGRIEEGAIEEVRQELLRELMARHPHGNVDVKLQVENHGEHQKIRIEANVEEEQTRSIPELHRQENPSAEVRSD